MPLLFEIFELSLFYMMKVGIIMIRKRRRRSKRRKGMAKGSRGRGGKSSIISFFMIDIKRFLYW